MRSKNYLFGSVIGLALAGMISTASAQVVNGGFETPVTPPGTFTLYTPGTNIGGFNVFGPAGSNVATISTTFSDFAGTNNAHSGLAFLDLTGSVDNGVQQGVSGSVATVQGQAYTLTFYIGHQRTDGSPTIIGVSTTGALGSYTQFTNGDTSGTDAASIVYAKFSLDFTATGAVTEIAFRNDQSGTIRSAALDDISIAPAVVAVPGPVAGAGLPALLALGGAWLAGRSRRRKAALSA